MLIVSSSSGEQCLRGTWIRAFDGFAHEGAGALAGSLWLEKNNGGWGPITILRVNLKSACRTFFLENFPRG